MLATLFGSPLAGSLLLAINSRRLGQSSLAFKQILGGAALLVVCLLLAYPELRYGGRANLLAHIMFRVAPLPGIFAMAVYSHGAPFRAIAAHQAAGGQVCSNWKALGIGMLFMLGLLLVGSTISIAKA